MQAKLLLFLLPFITSTFGDGENIPPCFNATHPAKWHRQILNKASDGDVFKGGSGNVVNYSAAAFGDKTLTIGARSKGNYYFQISLKDGKIKEFYAAGTYDYRCKVNIAFKDVQGVDVWTKHKW